MSRPIFSRKRNASLRAGLLLFFKYSSARHRFSDDTEQILLGWNGKRTIFRSTFTMQEQPRNPFKLIGSARNHSADGGGPRLKIQYSLRLGFSLRRWRLVNAVSIGSSSLFVPFFSFLFLFFFFLFTHDEKKIPLCPLLIIQAPARYVLPHPTSLLVSVFSPLLFDTGHGSLTSFGFRGISNFPVSFVRKRVCHVNWDAFWYVYQDRRKCYFWDCSRVANGSVILILHDFMQSFLSFESRDTL